MKSHVTLAVGLAALAVSGLSACSGGPPADPEIPAALFLTGCAAG